MKSWVSGSRLAVIPLLFALANLCSPAFAAVGRTPGSYQVSATGAATYTIPIFAPRGPNGLQPHIALTYNSQSGLGYLGVGWSLSGLSSIYRCNRTFAQDGTPAEVMLETSDALCIDGQRLFLSSGTYLAANSTYQTEIANFSNVTAYGEYGQGPSYFEVQGRDGRTYEYGNGGGSQVAAGTAANGLSPTVYIWYLDKVTDRAGNTMTIAYCSDDNGQVSAGCAQSGATASGIAVPATISWTPSSQGVSTYNYTMNFNYTANVPQVSVYGYVGGAAWSSTSLLDSISVEYSGTTVKKYVFSYTESSTTLNDLLTQVKECADAAETNCLAPTQLTYPTDLVMGVQSSPANVWSGTFSHLTAHNDFTGIGTGDLAYCNSGTPNVIYVLLGGELYGSPIDTGIPCNNPLYGDLTGSGKDGILVPNGTDWWYYTWSDGSFSGEDTGLKYDATASQYVLADVNGDGLPDLISGYASGGNYSIYVRLNNSAPSENTCSGSAVCFSGSNNLWYGPTLPVPGSATMISNTDESNSYGTLKGIDFNGDGQQDIAIEILSGKTVYAYALVSGTSLATGNPGFNAAEIGSASASADLPIAFLDFNSDTCTDSVFNGTIYVSACNGVLGQNQQIPLGTPVIGAMDWNGDGRTDILVANGSTIGVYLSEGNGISSLQSTSVPYNSGETYFVADMYGSGLDDLGMVPSSGTGEFSVYAHNWITGERPDLLTSVTDGYGNYEEPTYVSMEEDVGTVYFESSNAAYPYKNYVGPLYIVDQTSFSDASDPSGAAYSQADRYTGSWMNLQGRGFAGFASQEICDSRNGTCETWGYDQTFPYTGMLTSETLQTSTGANIETVSNTPSVTDFSTEGGQEAYFPYISSQLVKRYEVGGDENGDLVSTSTSSYSFDAYGNQKTVSTTVTDNDPGSQYDGDSWTTAITNTTDPDTSTWCLTLMTESQVTYSASVGASVTRTEDFTPDTTNCRYSEITGDPSGSYQVIEALQYDAFGNIETDTVTGAGMAARVSSANWGATGQFPMSITEPDSAGDTTQFNYDFSYGLLSSETDPNGLTTSWQYGDGFGRLTQETRPDGTYTTYTYNNCGGDGGCLMGANTLALSHFVYGTSGTIETDGTTYYDELERPVLSKDMMLSGSYNQNEVRYDNLGRVAQQAAPCAWSGTTTDACPDWTTMTYDILNRVTAVQRPINQGDSTLQTTSYAYAGDTVTIEDPNGNDRTLTHDVNGWLRQTEDAVGYAVVLGYDAAGDKTSITDNQANGPSDPLWTGTYATGAPFLLGETDVDRGTWGYTVDALGERTAWTDAKGQQFFEAYDALSRPVTRTEPDLFTQWTWGSSAANHNIGKLASVCSGTGSTCSSANYSESETYDSLGRLYQRSIEIPSKGTYTYTSLYNATTGLLDTLTYPTGSSGKALQLKYAYQNGILQSITDILDSPNVTIWQADAQNPAGQLTQETLGNGLVTTRAYDAVTHWLTSVQSGPEGGASVEDESFLYDEMGDVTQRQDGIHDLSENFYYDDDYRFRYSTLNGTQNQSLTYADNGNITNNSNVSSSNWTYSPSHVHQVTEAGYLGLSYAYDANGNMTSRSGIAQTWTSYNYPSQLAGTSFTYTFSYAPDRTIWREIQTGSPADTTYRLGSPLMSIVVNSSGTTDRNYIYAGNEPVAIDERSSSSNTFYYLLTDHQGSLYGITNSSGTMVIGESFAAFGERRNPTAWTIPISGLDLNTIAGITPRGYTFKETLMGLNLIDLGGRVEDSSIGRFLLADPNIPDPTDPQSYNRYSYTRNNPLTLTDPTGFDDNDGDDQSALTNNPNGGSGSSGGGNASGISNFDSNEPDFGLSAYFNGLGCVGNCVSTVWVGQQVSYGGKPIGPVWYFPELVPASSTGIGDFFTGGQSSGEGNAFGSGSSGFGAAGSAGSLKPPAAPAQGASPQQTTKPPCGTVRAGQLAVGASAAFFNSGRNWSAGPGANTAAQAFWKGSAGKVTAGWGVELTAGLSFTLSLSTSVLPPGMVENWSPTGTYGELQGDFVLGGGISWSFDDGSITIGLKPSVGFAAYYGQGTTTDSTIATSPLTCQFQGAQSQGN